MFLLVIMDFKIRGDVIIMQLVLEKPDEYKLSHVNQDNL